MNCPVCNKELEFDLPELEGVYYDCSVCSSSLFFQKGKCEVISRGELSQKESQPENSENQISAQPEENTSKESIDQTPQEVFESDTEQSSPEESSTEQEDVNQLEEPLSHLEQADRNQLNSEPTPSPFDEVTEVPEIGEEEPNEFMEQENEQDLSQDRPAQDETSFVFKEEEEPVKEDFSEVVEFSNNREQKEKGLYLYQLFLSEINSQALKDKVISLLEDSSLEIDLQEQYREEIINKGKIVLPELSAIQVYVILHHLMGLPLKVHWEQSHIADS